MKYIESNYIELKEIVNADFKKEIIAFANTDGGNIYVGVSKNGEIIGVDNPESEMEKISNMIRDGIRPDLTAYTEIQTITEENKSIIQITVSSGERKPYHLSDKGLKPSGVYIRHGVTSAPASEENIRQMIKESDGTTFDKARSINQDLTFDFAETYFKSKNISFTENNKRTLGMVTPEGYYTNTALLLSDQCEHSIKCAVYEDTSKMKFKARKEFFGSIFKQLEDAYEYINLNNNINSDFEGLYRIDHPDYPQYAIREALLNTMVHRDYDYSGSTLVNIFTDRMEFVSLGGLVKGITLQDIYHGISQSRNMTIAAIFYRLELMESYGTGIPRIIDSYSFCNRKPEFIAGPASFVTILPNQNTEIKIAPTIPLSLEEQIYVYIKEKASATRKELEIHCNCSSFPINKALNKLLEQEKIKRIGNGRSTHYTL